MRDLDFRALGDALRKIAGDVGGRKYTPAQLTAQRINNTYRGTPPPGVAAPDRGPAAKIPPLFERAIYNNEGEGSLKPSARVDNVRGADVAAAAKLPMTRAPSWDQAAVNYPSETAPPTSMALADEMPRRMAYHELAHRFDPAPRTAFGHESEIPAMVSENNAARLAGWRPQNEDWVQQAMQKYGPALSGDTKTDAGVIQRFMTSLRGDTTLGRGYLNYLKAQGSPGLTPR